MHRRFPIVFWARVFVGVVCLALVAIDGWRSWTARAERLLEMERATFNLARAMAQQADDSIKAADTSVAELVERIEVDGLGEAALARLHTRMVAQVANLPQLGGLFAYDEQGRWLVNSRPLLNATLNNADREYFRHHRSHPGRAAYVGLPVVSRSTGQWIIPVSRRIDKPDGGFGGVVLATVDLDHFRRFYQSLDVGRHGAVALFNNAGVLLLRRPFDDATIGQDLRGSNLYAAFMPQRLAGSASLLSPLDGQVRLNSYRPLQHYPLFVTAALSRDEMLAQWRRDTFLRSLGVLLLAAMLGLFGQRLVRQIGLRERAEGELRAARDALEQVNRTLERQAMQDGLTGLANRRQFDVTLGNEFSRAMRYQHLLAFVMVDVDYFKQYNDEYGHSKGDDCLRAVCAQIRAQTPKRPGDLTARYGGEELAILLPDTDLAGAHAVAERVRAAVEALQLPHAASPFGVVTISAGVATLMPQRDVHLAGMLVDAADQALYGAKSDGRNRVARAPVLARLATEPPPPPRTT